MKRLAALVAFLLTINYLVAPQILNFSLDKLPQAMQVSAAMGAKIACSARFVTGLSPEQIRQDLNSYSPANDVLDIQYLDNRVTTDFLGIKQASATYRKGIGCSLDNPNSELDDVVIAENDNQSQAEWPLGGLSSEQSEELNQLLADIMQRDNDTGLDTRALVVIHNDKLIAESYQKGFDHNTPLLGWSMAKSITAIMQGRAEALGLLSNQDQSLFEQWQNDDRKTIKAADLLTMTSGLAFDESYTPGTDATEMLFNQPQASSVPLAQPLEAKVGERFYYSSGTTNLINLWLYQQLGQSTQAQYDFLYQALFNPMGIENAVFEADSSGVLVGSSYLYANARDWARFGYLLLNKGEINGQRLLTEQWVEQAITANLSNNDSRYGYQLWLNRGSQDDDLRWENLPADAYAMRGNRKQIVMVIPSSNAVIVRLGWTKGPYTLQKNFSTILAHLPKA
ncbi:serine hydrolase [Catenovulum sp. SM1970]|uniref:serine hydrolase domain-containing protein n=1 Tax=Marinifaba aquimaris TaxID=2741323 RepID=UPI0015735525|nr:serine hydrolase [Marinifaba aquimaris]NTS76748.1 serine hydrolase [Marinifaba aquimaris]